MLLHRRLPDGSVKPCLFVIEKSTNVIVVEACGDSMVGEAQKEVASWQPKLPASMNASVQADSDAMVVLLDILSTDTPCTLPGCDGWRAQLQVELDKLPADCTSCDRNSVVRRVARSLQPAVTGLLAAHPEYRLQKPGIPQSS